MFESIFFVFLAIFLSELGDKTQLIIFALSNKCKNKLTLFFVALLAFVLVDGLIIFFGEIIDKVLPHSAIQIIAGLLFFYFGISILLEKKEDCEVVDVSKVKKKKFFISSFLLLALAEMGDKSQITAFLLSTQYGFLATIIGLTIAFSILIALAIFLSTLIKKKYICHIQKCAGVLFIAFGILAFISLL